MARVFHGFEIKEKIGSGGMSTVYKGYHATLGYPVAIKTLHGQLADDENFISRFEREAKAASSLKHNNIVSVIDFGSEEEVYFIIMEYVDGHDLAKLFDDFQDPQRPSRPFPAEITLILLEEVAYGLKAAHDQGIIHRDIKPSNVLLNKQGEVKLADFGLAREVRTMSRLLAKDLTTPGMIVGTPSYMSPEQAAASDTIDHRTDIFSLGVVAYQFLTGEKPFIGSTPSEIQERIIRAVPPPLTRDRCPQLTAQIAALVDKMLAKDPGKRFQSMDQVLRALADCMESVDATNALIKFRRSYLSQFALDPRRFSEELRRQNITAHLQRGFHFKNMGLENIGDAMAEFRNVLMLDPDNSKAVKALTDLESQRGEAAPGTAAAAGAPGASGQTMVLKPGGAAPGAPARAPTDAEPGTGTARGGAAGGLGVAGGDAPPGAEAVPAAGATRIMPPPGAPKTPAAPPGGARQRSGAKQSLGAFIATPRGRIAAIAAAALLVVAVVWGLASNKGGPQQAGIGTDTGAAAGGIAQVAPGALEAAKPGSPGAGGGAGGAGPAGAPGSGEGTAATGSAASGAGGGPAGPAGSAGAGTGGSQPAPALPGAGPGAGSGAGAGTGGAAAAVAGRKTAGADSVAAVLAAARQAAADSAAQARRRGNLELKIDPPSDVYLNDKQVATRMGEGAVPAPRGKCRLELRCLEIFGRATMDLDIPARKTIPVEYRFKTGMLSFEVDSQVEVVIDGYPVDRQVRGSGAKVAVGKHRIGVRREGYKVASAQDVSSMTGGRILLKPLGEESGLTIYEVTVVEGRSARLAFEMRRSR